ncbi:hypothetical protein [Flavisolibacter nicotianae]|uniref:hypothetical protein n=1 Tax=Flavisolibacter nicotianae TaxID=2364882 RepID=UPI0013C45486|nr:hypothetical protein [Flavisolibacter nicotianae]
MENLIALLATSLVLRAANSRFRRYVICPGCSALLHPAAKRLHVRRTKDGDRLLFNEHKIGTVKYGMICVQLNKVYSLEKSEEILVNFINRCRKPLQIECNQSMEIEQGAGQLCLTDYWQDKDGIDWKIKGSTNGKIISLLYVRNITDTTVTSHDAFLNGFRFSPVQ